jgi:hypothetical protein
MRVLLHVAFSAVVAVIVGSTYGSIPALFAFLAGVLIDGDHLVDWWLWSEERSFRSLLVLGTWLIKPHITDLFLHSYELLIPLWIFVWFTGAYSIGIGITTGFLVHLITDQIYNSLRYGVDPLNLFLTYRTLRMNKRLADYEKRLAIYETVLRRDNFKCQLCGKSGNPRLEIHMEKYAIRQNSPDKYITVCSSCHTKKHVFFWKLLNEKHN